MEKQAYISSTGEVDTGRSRACWPASLAHLGELRILERETMSQNKVDGIQRKTLKFFPWTLHA